MSRRTHRTRLQFEALEDRLAPAVLDLAGIEWRSLDGSNNNLTPGLEQQGAAETRQIRFGYGAQFPDGFGDAILTGPQRANPRTISNAIHAQGGSVLNDRHLTDWAFQWGQWITHDLDLTNNGAEYNRLSTGAVGDFRIPVLDPGDPLGPNPIPFNRSQFDPLTGTPDPVPGPPPHLNRRETVNSVTSYIDASMVYGSDPVRAAALRTFQGGMLKTSAGGQLLPLNTDGLPNADPLRLGGQLFLAGDVRANEQANLTVVHTLFVREHNRLAARIAQLYPDLSDEQVYQFARRIVGAEVQIITYEEYLPAVFGQGLAPDPGAAVYDPGVNATVTNSFAHAVFRFGHSQISPATLLVDNTGRTAGSLAIRDAFFNPDVLKGDPANVGRMLKGLASQLAQENDLQLVDGVRNSLFGPPGAGGLDLAALDIQRGRDHGLPDYNTLRKAYGLARVTSFAQISSDPQTQAKLQLLFGTVDNIDAFVGALAEDHLPGSSVGPLVHALVGDQFERVRDGDRFFYANDAFLRTDEARRVINLDRVTLAQVIHWNSTITNLQGNVFFEGPAPVFGAPADGPGATPATAAPGAPLVTTDTGPVLAGGPMRGVSQVALVGSYPWCDFVTLVVAAPNGGLGDGAAARVASSNGVMGVSGAPGQAPPVGPPEAAVNGNPIQAVGSELIHVATPGGQGGVLSDSGIAGAAQLWTWHDPFEEG